MTVALYCRVSTDEQAEHGFSINHQKERLAAYCASQGWQHYEFFVDDGYSGTNMDRPQLQRLIRAVRSGRIKTVVVYRLDRLSRKQKDVLYLLEDVFDRNGVTFKSATEPFDTSTPLGKAMLGILAVFAQLERDTLVERVTSGKSQRTRKGLWYGGPVPYGYRWSSESQQLIVVPEEAALVREMFERLLRGQSYKAIGRWMDARTKARLFSHHKTMIYMLTNPVYAGKLNHNGSLVDGTHEPIIDEYTWRRAQEEIKRRKSGRRPYGRYLLSHLLVCGVCGSTMKHYSIKDKRYNPPRIHEYYICSTKHRHPGQCKSPYHAKEKLEAAVIQTLQELSLDQDHVRAELAASRHEDVSSTELVDTLEKQLQEVSEQLERWYDAYGRGFDPVQVEKRIRALEEQKRALELRIEEIGVIPDEDKDEQIVASLQMIGQQWHNMTDEERHEIIRTVVTGVVVNADGTVRMNFNV